MIPRPRPSVSWQGDARRRSETLEERRDLSDAPSTERRHGRSTVPKVECRGEATKRHGRAPSRLSMKTKATTSPAVNASAPIRPTVQAAPATCPRVRDILLREKGHASCPNPLPTRAPQGLHERLRCCKHLNYRGRPDHPPCSVRPGVPRSAMQ